VKCLLDQAGSVHCKPTQCHIHRQHQDMYHLDVGLVLGFLELAEQKLFLLDFLENMLDHHGDYHLRIYTTKDYQVFKEIIE